ncbi:hypothetical protein FWH09_01160, partial [Candidatus Saccharibacteria bacterium]|nr:hypothetical protein [Candidatus Saccharibacteria bacterium]
MKGKVIDLGDGNPWLVVQSAAQTGTKAGYVYIMAMHNYGNGTWGSDNANPTIAISRLADDGTGVLYNSLPATIGGVAKATALGSHNWQWDICSFANPAVCSNTVASTSRLSFVSYREWQGGTGDYLTEPTSGSVGNLFCAAWKGTVCIGSNIYTSSNFNYPWS